MQSELNKAVFLDRDGVINFERGDYTWLLEDFKLTPDLAPALRLLKEAGFYLIIISNQGGIEKGMFSKAEVEYLHLHLIRNLRNQGVELDEIYYCPHHQQESKCICRKPDSLLLEKAIARFQIDAQNSWFIGDAERDIQAGQKAGVKTIKVESNRSLMDLVPKILGEINS